MTIIALRWSSVYLCIHHSTLMVLGLPLFPIQPPWWSKSNPYSYHSQPGGNQTTHVAITTLLWSSQHSDDFHFPGGPQNLPTEITATLHSSCRHNNHPGGPQPTTVDITDNLVGLRHQSHPGVPQTLTIYIKSALVDLIVSL